MRDNKWVRLLAYVTGLVNQRLLLQNEYLIAENRILSSLWAYFFGGAGSARADCASGSAAESSLEPSGESAYPPAHLGSLCATMSPWSTPLYCAWSSD